MITEPPNIWRLLSADGKLYDSAAPGTFGGHKGSRIYGHLDCPSAIQAIARGGYVGQRVFFADEAAAIAAGFRPCAICMPERYAEWKAQVSGRAHSPPDAVIRRSVHCYRSRPADSA